MPHCFWCVVFTLLGQGVLYAEVLFIIVGDVGCGLQGEGGLLQFVLGDGHLNGDVVRLGQLLPRLEVADDERHQVCRHLLRHLELVSHL